MRFLINIILSVLERNIIILVLQMKKVASAHKHSIAFVLFFAGLYRLILFPFAIKPAIRPSQSEVAFCCVQWLVWAHTGTFSGSVWKLTELECIFHWTCIYGEVSLELPGTSTESLEINPQRKVEPQNGKMQGSGDIIWAPKSSYVWNKNHL